MKIIVCIKQILDPRGITVNRKAEKVFVNREEYVLDPASKAALEVAEQIKAKEAAVEIIALSVGPERVDEALREALARGADRAILIRSDGKPNPAVIAHLLAAAINHVLTSPVECAEMRERAARRALQHFTADCMVEATLAVYREGLGARG